MSGGKGSKARPLSVDREQFKSNWDKIFSKKCECDCTICIDNPDSQKLIQLGEPKKETTKILEI